MSDPRLKRRCSLMGCTDPASKHHHHYHADIPHLNTRPCRCPERGIPGSDGVS